ncbi:MAG: 30S ribosome-binding factor RbfA [Lentisphaeria bacterium]
MTIDRMRRVNEVLKRELGSAFEKDLAGEFDALITITQVETSNDLRHAKVFVSVMGSDEQREAVLQKLEEYRPHFQERIAKRITLKFTPVLRFEIDRTPERADRILSIIDEIDIPEEEPDK